jgi:hypothetical protein
MLHSLCLQRFRRVIGVSEQCCPTCHTLIQFLVKDPEHLSRPFLIRGSHRIVTACTLPVWLPAEIVESMNAYFGNQLRKELVNLYRRFESRRDRMPSMGLRRGSMPGEYNHPPVNNVLYLPLPDEDCISTKPLRPH